MAKNQYKSALDQANRELDSMYAKWDAIDKKILAISKNARQTANVNFNSGVPKEANARIKKNVEHNEQLNAALKEQDRLEKALITQIAKKNAASESTNRALVKERFETNQINKTLRRQAVLNSSLSTEYQKLSTKLLVLKDRYKDLGAKKINGIKLTKDETKEYERLSRTIPKTDAAIKRLDKSVGDNFRNVGNYKSALNGLKNVFTSLVGVIGVVGAARMAFDFSKEAIQLARQAKGVEFAFKQLGAEGEDALLRIKRATRGMLSELDIKTALNEFDQFNLSVQRADTLFEFLAVAASQTGKSIDELKSSLVEGLSKESKLRIDNLGISVTELNAELEKTPEFIDAVANIAERKIAAAGSILDDATNSQQKFNAALEDFKVSAGSGFIGDFTNEVYGLGSAFLSATRDINDASDGVLDFIMNMYKYTLMGGGAAVAAEAEAKRILQQNKKITEDIIFEQKKRYESEEDFLWKRFQLEKLNTDQLLTIYRSFMEKKDAALDPKKEEENSKTRAELYGEERTVIERMGDAFDVVKEQLKTFFEQGVISADSYKAALERVEEQQRKVMEISGAPEGLWTDPVGTPISASYGGEIQKMISHDPSDVEESFDAIEDSMKSLIDTLGLGQTEFQNFFDSLKESLDGAIEGYDDLKHSAADFLRLAGTGVQALADSKNQALEEEIRGLERRRDADVHYKRATEQEKERIDAQYQRIIDRRRREQAQNDKEAAIFQSVINTISAVVEALPNIPLSIAVGLIGAANTAAIAAKPIPALKDGDLTGNVTGAVLINDQKGSKYQEIVERKGGGLELYSGRNVIIDKKKGDKVHKAGTFNGIDLANSSLAISMANQNEALTDSQTQQIINLGLGNEIEKQMDRAISKIKGKDINYNRLGDSIARSISFDKEAARA